MKGPAGVGEDFGSDWRGVWGEGEGLRSRCCVGGTLGAGRQPNDEQSRAAVVQHTKNRSTGRRYTILPASACLAISDPGSHQESRFPE
jgi:hypothetical protein